MEADEAYNIIEALRKGVPPRGYSNLFTVGRKSEIAQLKIRLDSHQPGKSLIKANTGSGKSHLLQYIRENALESQYVVSYVTLDSNSGIRFNRMDQIVGAIWRGLEVPSKKGEMGVRPFFDLVCKKIADSKSQNKNFWNDLTNNGQWDYSELLESPSMFIALRSWNTKNRQAQDLIENWFYEPYNFDSQRQTIYGTLIYKLENYFRDPRDSRDFFSHKPGKFYFENREHTVNPGIFNFRIEQYRQSWQILQDIDTLAKKCGFRGFIILFDELEDILDSLKNINYQEAAFINLLHFFFGNQFPVGEFPGGSYFAVTPDFVNKCNWRLYEKGKDWGSYNFDILHTFNVNPLEVQELEELAFIIMPVHGIAYAWNPNLVVSRAEIKSLVARFAASPAQNRTRETIKGIVKFLDSCLEGL